MIRKCVIVLFMLVVAILLAGCGGRKSTVSVPAAPAVSRPATETQAQASKEDEELKKTLAELDKRLGLDKRQPAAPELQQPTQPVLEPEPVQETTPEPVPAPEQPAVQSAPVQSTIPERVETRINGRVRVTVSGIPIYPPVQGQQYRLSDGQIIVAAQEIFQTPVGESFLAALKAAKTRAAQEDAVLRFISKDLQQKFEEMNRQPEDTTEVDPDNYPPARDRKTALENRVYTDQDFVPFEGWGASPFGPPAKSWQDLHDRYEKYIEAMIERTNYPAEIKVEWADTLRKVLENGPDGKFSKEVDLRDWPYWHWTTGLMASNAVITDPKTGQRRRRGINIHYTGGPAKGLAIYLRKAGMWIIHAYECRGNPIVPILGPSLFGIEKVTDTPKEPPKQCECTIVTAQVGNSNISTKAEIFPGQSVTLRANVTGLTDEVQVQSEQWTVNGDVRVSRVGTREFTFDSSKENFKLGSYEIAYELTDQFGRVTRCVFTVVVKPVPAPPPVVTKLPPTPIAPPKVDKPRRRWWPYILAGAAAAGVAIALTQGGGSPSKPAGTPGVPGFPGGIPEPR